MKKIRWRKKSTMKHKKVKLLQKKNIKRLQKLSAKNKNILDLYNSIENYSNKNYKAAMAYKYRSLLLEDELKRAKAESADIYNKYMAANAMIINLLTKVDEKPVKIKKEEISYIVKKILEDKYLLQLETDADNYYISFKEDVKKDGEHE